MGKLERLFHKLKWNSIRNLWKRLFWRWRSYYHVEANRFMIWWDADMWANWELIGGPMGRITFKTGLPWGRVHPDHPFQVMGLNSVIEHKIVSVMEEDKGRIDLTIIPNHQTVYSNGNTYNPEIDAGCIYSEQEFLYGEFELECTLADKGQWLAFWLLGDHGWPPEIDIFEFFHRILFPIAFEIILLDVKIFFTLNLQ